MEKFVGPDEGAFAARRVIAPYTLRAATWGGPYGYYGTLYAVGAACGRLRAGEDTGPYGGYHSLAVSP